MKRGLCSGRGGVITWWADLERISANASVRISTAAHRGACASIDETLWSKKKRRVSIAAGPSAAAIADPLHAIRSFGHGRPDVGANDGAGGTVRRLRCVATTSGRYETPVRRVIAMSAPYIERPARIRSVRRGDARAW